MADVSVLNFHDGGGNRNVKDSKSVHNIKVNGVTQTVSSNTVDLDIATNLITEEQWTSIQSILS